MFAYQMLFGKADKAGFSRQFCFWCSDNLNKHSKDSDKSKDILPDKTKNRFHSLSLEMKSSNVLEESCYNRQWQVVRLEEDYYVL